MADDALDFGIDLDDVRERLRTLRYFLTVEGIEDGTTAIEEGCAMPPSAYASIASETAEPNKLIGNKRQRVNVVVSVLYAENAARIDGERRDTVDATKKAVIAIMRNWTPKGAIRALEYDRFRQRAIIDGTIWAEVLFTSAYEVH